MGDTLCVAGTKILRDVWDDLVITFGLASSSHRYDDAGRVLRAATEIRRVVGHSLGRAVVLQLQKSHPQLNPQSETYGAPVLALSGSNQKQRQWLDPEAILDGDAETTMPRGLNPHSCQALAARKMGANNKKTKLE